MKSCEDDQKKKLIREKKQNMNKNIGLMIGLISKNQKK